MSATRSRSNSNSSSIEREVAAFTTEATRLLDALSTSDVTADVARTASSLVRTIQTRPGVLVAVRSTLFAPLVLCLVDAAAAPELLRLAGVLLADRGAWMDAGTAKTVVERLVLVAASSTSTLAARMEAVTALGNACTKARAAVALPYFGAIWGATIACSKANQASWKLCWVVLRALRQLLNELQQPQQQHHLADNVLTAGHVGLVVPLLVDILQMQSRGVESDSELSDADEPSATAASYITKLHLLALAVTETLLHRGGKLVHPHWFTLVAPLCQFLQQRQPATTLAASNALIALVEASQPLLAMAEMPKRTSASFVSLSEKLALSVVALYQTALECQRHQVDDPPILRLLTTLVRSGPAVSKLGPYQQHLPLRIVDFTVAILTSEGAGEASVAAALEAVSICASSSAVAAKAEQYRLVGLVEERTEASSDLIAVAAWSALRSLLAAGLLSDAVSAHFVARAKSKLALVGHPEQLQREHEQVAALLFLRAIIVRSNSGNAAATTGDILDHLRRFMLASISSPSVASVCAAAMDTVGQLPGSLFEGTGEEWVRVCVALLSVGCGVPAATNLRISVWTFVGSSICGIVGTMPSLLLADTFLPLWQFAITNRAEILAVKVRAAWALAAVCAYAPPIVLTDLVIHLCQDSDKVRLFGLRAAGSLIGGGDVAAIEQPSAEEIQQRRRLVDLVAVNLESSELSAKSQWNAAAAASRIFGSSPAHLVTLDAHIELEHLRNALCGILRPTPRLTQNYKVSIHVAAALTSIAFLHTNEFLGSAAAITEVLDNTLLCIQSLAAVGSDRLTFQEQRHRSALDLRVRKIQFYYFHKISLLFFF